MPTVQGKMRFFKQLPAIRRSAEGLVILISVYSTASTTKKLCY